jgi:hypothetical protein
MVNAKRSIQNLLPLQLTYCGEALIASLLSYEDCVLFGDTTKPLPTFENVGPKLTVQPSSFLLLRQVVMGGTFDHMHCGHKKLLHVAGACCAVHLLIASLLSSPLFI